MSKALALYFAIFGFGDAVVVAFDWFDGRAILTVGAVVRIALWFALAAALYRRYRVARIGAAGFCAVMTGLGVIVWCMSGFEHHILLMGSVVFGVPLVGLLHPRARSEFDRSVRFPAWSRQHGSDVNDGSAQE